MLLNLMMEIIRIMAAIILCYIVFNDEIIDFIKLVKEVQENRTK